MIQELYKLEARIFNLGSELCKNHITFETFPTEKECQDFKEYISKFCKYGSIELTITKF